MHFNGSLKINFAGGDLTSQFRRTGGTTDIQLDIRIISATNEDPEILLEEKRLREDLYYRLGFIQIELPELKDRKSSVFTTNKWILPLNRSNWMLSVVSVNTIGPVISEN
jgi:arginine utilization regulatory protein